MSETERYAKDIEDGEKEIEDIEERGPKAATCFEWRGLRGLGPRAAGGDRHILLIAF